MGQKARTLKLKERHGIYVSLIFTCAYCVCNNVLCENTYCVKTVLLSGTVLLSSDRISMEHLMKSFVRSPKPKL